MKIISHLPYVIVDIWGYLVFFPFTLISIKGDSVKRLCIEKASRWLEGSNTQWLPSEVIAFCQWPRFLMLSAGVWVRSEIRSEKRHVQYNDNHILVQNAFPVTVTECWLSCSSDIVSSALGAPSRAGSLKMETCIR